MPIESITSGSSMVPAGGYSGVMSSVAPQMVSSASAGGASVISVGQDAGYSAAFDGKQAINDTSNAVASNIQVADQAMSSSSEALAQMKASLNAALTKFPYQPLHNDRIRLIGTYVAARTLMIKDSVPPEFLFAWKITSDPDSQSGAGDQTVTVGNGAPSVTVRSQPITAGSAGLNLPELPAAASDEHIAAAVSSIDRAQVAISDKRAALASDAAQVADTVAAAVKAAIPGMPAPYSLPGSTDPAITDKSKEISQMIATHTGASLTGKNNETLRLFL